MKKIIQNFISTPAFFIWQALIALFLLLSALFFQYFLGLEPCELCVFQRLIFNLIILVSLFALLFNHLFFKVIFILILIIGYLVSFWLALYQVDIEMGNVISACKLGSIFPSWFSLDIWLPSIYKATALCSDVSWNFFGFTMAEILSYAAIFLAFWSLLSLIYSFKQSANQKSNNYHFDL